MAFLLLLALPHIGSTQEVKTDRIWARAPHNAFPDLLRHDDYFYCVLREGINHVPYDSTENGVVRILRSRKGKRWKSVAVLKSPVYDLRDPKISVNPEGRLMVLMGGSHYVDGKKLEGLSHVSFSSNGRQFSDPEPVRVADDIRSRHDWVWRITWHEGKGYAVMYQVIREDNTRRAMLVSSIDGIQYELVSKLSAGSHPNEATVRFGAEDEMFILLRREGGQNGYFGKSGNPYTRWTWNDLGFRLGGPNFIMLEDGRFCLGSRHYKAKGTGTAITVLDSDLAVKKRIDFTSGGDTGYPGMVKHGNFLWVVYYSSHEGKTAIYLGRLPLESLQ
jgi:hypothetical protein